MLRPSASARRRQSRLLLFSVFRDADRQIARRDLQHALGELLHGPRERASESQGGGGEKRRGGGDGSEKCPGGEPRERAARQLRLQEIDARQRQLARKRGIARGILRALEQGIEPAEREGEHPREPEADDQTAAGERQEARGEHHREEPSAEPAPGSVVVHRVRAYTKKRPLPKGSRFMVSVA
jgi:hypothetical protein